MENYNQDYNAYFDQNKKNKKSSKHNKKKNKKDKDKQKTIEIEKELTDENYKAINENRIQEKDLKNLDDFIQSCLNKFKFIDPLQSFYDKTGDDKNLIISHKSTIPDLVIWNKTFNKNECFEDADLKKENKFPRFTFFLRLNKEKDIKKNNNKKEKKNKKSKKIKKVKIIIIMLMK